jgi:hypothetical protein
MLPKTLLFNFSRLGLFFIHKIVMLTFRFVIFSDMRFSW